MSKIIESMNLKVYKNRKLLLWAICIFILVMYWIIFHPNELCGDAQSYWNRSLEFIVDGQFSFTNYASLLRGYVFPFILLLQRGFGVLPQTVEMFCWALTFMMMIAAIVVYQLPWIARNLFGKELSGRKILALEILFCIFWQGNLLYPLSDFYAVFFLNYAIILFYKLNRFYSEYSWIKNVIMAFAMGICVYITYSIRAMYVFFAIAVFVVFFIQNIKKNIKKTALVLGAALLGCLFVSIPQIAINNVHASKLSPLVLGERNGEKINNKQLYWGLYYSRYETYVGDPDVYPHAGVIFEDKAGKAIIEKEGLQDLTPVQAIKLYLKYPFDIIGIYGRHLLNAMDNRFPELYITDLYKSRIGYMLGNYCIWFAFFIFWSAQRRVKGTTVRQGICNRWQYIGLMVLSSFVMLAGAIEIRFFLPIYCMVYLYVVMHFSKRTLRRCWDKYGIWLGVFAVIGLGLYIAYSGNTLVSIYEGNPILF